ncbi:MAG TPA: hypothetical protein VIM42_06825 [Clostridium sp.]
MNIIIQYKPFPYPSNNDNANQKAMSPTPAVMSQPNKVMPQSNKVMQEPSKDMPQVHADFQDSEIPPTTSIINNPLYNQGWLKTQIGKFISIDFLIGNMYIDRQGVLQEVGISYIIIKESGTNDIVMCDIYSIKFVTVFGDQASKCRV